MQFLCKSGNSTVYEKTNSILKKCDSHSIFVCEVLILKMLQGHKNFPKMIKYNIKDDTIELKKYSELHGIEKYKEKICNAVFFMHKKGIIHCDLKPDNVMLDTETDEPIIIDFGNSVFDTQPAFEWASTEGFYPPKMYRKRELHSFDVWSLSVVFGLDIANRPESRPNANQLVGLKKSEYEYGMFKPAVNRKFKSECLYQNEVIPEIRFTMKQKTNLHRFYNETNDVKKTLIASGFSQMSYTDMVYHTKIMSGSWCDYRITEIEVPKFNIIRWMRKNKLENYNQVLWCLLATDAFNLESIEKCPTIDFNSSFIIPVDPNFYTCNIKKSQISGLKRIMEMKLETEKQVKPNYDLFCSKYKI